MINVWETLRWTTVVGFHQTVRELSRVVPENGPRRLPKHHFHHIRPMQYHKLILVYDYKPLKLTQLD
jgi:hypothetical protein